MTLVTKKTTFPLTLVCLIAVVNTGCATRALMSSDRYEKPAETQYQNQSLHNKNNTLMAQQYAEYQLKVDSISP
jgi:hypothetical protein